MTAFNPAKLGDTVIIRLRGTGFAFQPFDNMVLCRVNKVTKTGRIQGVTAYNSGNRYTSRDWFQINTLDNVGGDRARAAFPEAMFLPWGEGFNLLKSLVRAPAVAA